MDATTATSLSVATEKVMGCQPHSVVCCRACFDRVVQMLPKTGITAVLLCLDEVLTVALQFDFMARVPDMSTPTVKQGPCNHLLIIDAYDSSCRDCHSNPSVHCLHYQH